MPTAAPESDASAATCARAQADLSARVAGASPTCWASHDGTPCRTCWAPPTDGGLTSGPDDTTTVTEAVADLSETVAAVTAAIAGSTHVYDTADRLVTIVRAHGADGARPGYLFKITTNTIATDPSGVDVWTESGWAPFTHLHGPIPEAVALAAYEILAGRE